MQKAILGQVACDPVPERRAGRSVVLGVSSMKCAARTQSPPPNWDTVSPAACFTASPAPLSSPVYFTGLVPAAIFPIRGAIPALILVERMVRKRWEEQALPRPHAPSFTVVLWTPTQPCPQSYLALLPFLCVHPDGLVVTWGEKGGYHQPPIKASPGGAGHKTGERASGTLEGPGLGFVK